ncbi:hypothetical protein RvY_06083-1 [Ramazzottius varieornatus]|uniref:Uncharacterized protein n=1 Tax=Ramazzottius varieornatus TaxID=947166 RepID=A0A1D1V2T9_RAMVA|nr:hypothetical protein RvY_06083-1 [Ramazzottius varieornatus]
MKELPASSRTCLRVVSTVPSVVLLVDSVVVGGVVKADCCVAEDVVTIAEVSGVSSSVVLVDILAGIVSFVAMVFGGGAAVVVGLVSVADVRFASCVGLAGLILSTTPFMYFSGGVIGARVLWSVSFSSSISGAAVTTASRELVVERSSMVLTVALVVVGDFVGKMRSRHCSRRASSSMAAGTHSRLVLEENLIEKTR